MAIAFRMQVDEDTEFALWKIEEQADDLYKQLQLNDTEKAYIEQLGKGKRNLHWLSTRVLLRTMLNTSEYIDCQVDDHGKPYLVNMPYKMSMSHSFDYAAVMLSKSKPVGIDIELVSNKVERIAHKFLNARELDMIQPEHKIEQLYIYWCAKEAVYKCNGRKVISFLDHIRIEAVNWDKKTPIQVAIEKGEMRMEFDVNYMPFGDYMIGYVKAK
jgi:phosphopantetheinyl transferase